MTGRKSDETVCIVVHVPPTRFYRNSFKFIQFGMCTHFKWVDHHIEQSK